MGTLFIRHRVQDYPRWKKAFDEHESVRVGARMESHVVYRDETDPNQITLMFETDDLDEARAFAASDELADVMKKAGVIGKPDISFCAELESKSYETNQRKGDERESHVIQ